MKPLILIIFLSFSVTGLSQECLLTRAAFDMGSGATRMKVALVNICKKTILKVFLSKKLPVKYQEYLTKNKTNVLGPRIKKKGLLAFLKLKQMAVKFKPQEYIGVATSALRKAKNGLDFTKEIYAKSGIKIHIINQKKEAELGYFAAVAQGTSGYRFEDIVVWDIGGGSMQITSLGPSRNLIIYEGSLASISFKNWLIEKVKGLSTRRTNSPNPMSLAQIMKGIGHAKKVAQEEVPYLLKRKTKNKRSLIIGIGAIHNFSVLKRFKKYKKNYSALELKNVIGKLADKTDAQIGGSYAATDYSNLGLVLGLMQGLGIEKVQVRNVNMTDGVLIDSALADQPTN